MQTPRYEYSRAAIAARIDELTSLNLPYGLTVRYAMKANPFPEILQLLHEGGFCWYDVCMSKKVTISICAFVFILISGFALNKERAEVPVGVEVRHSDGADYQHAVYTIEGQVVELVDGYAESAAAPGAASMVITRVFGNELRTDLDGDGDEDVALILTQETGGSATFYYAVAALQTDEGYIGSDGYLLGDRIAPQSTTISPNPRHVNVVVFNYAERADGEPMTASPSVGKSAYLKIVPETNRWAIVEPDFAGESVY